MNLSRTNLLLSILVLFCANLPGASSVQAQERIEWLAGSKLTESSKTLAVSVSWQGAPLRQRLGGLAERQRIAIFLDRRVDGSQTVDFSVNNVSFEECLWRLCDQLELGMCRVDDIYYVGPRETAGRLTHHVNELKAKIDKADRAVRRRWEREQALDIPRLAQPRELVVMTCQNLGAALEASDAVPHDLWAASQLPKAEAVTRLALLLVGFGKTIEPSSDLGQIRIVELPAASNVTRVFQLGADAKKGAALIQAEMPTIELKVKSRSVEVTSSPLDSLRVHRLLVSMQKPEVADLSLQVFTLNSVNKRGTILATIAKQLGREFRFQPGQVDLLNERIEVNLVNAPVEQVISAALANSGLTYRITDEQLQILGGSEPDDKKRP